MKPGDRVTHRKDPGATGTVTEVDNNLKGTTTCKVLWDDSPTPEVQWTDKLHPLS